MTVVVEAAAGSGTLITVEAALAQGRDVMVVPGPITSPTSVGTNRLLRDGATPFLEAGDLLAMFPEVLRREAPPSLEPAAPSPPLPLAPLERRVFESLDRSPRHLDTLVEVVAAPAADVLAALCTLELHGVALQEPGRRFLRA